MADAVDIGRLTDHQATVVYARLHPTNVITHDEQDVGFLSACLWTSTRTKQDPGLLKIEDSQDDKYQNEQRQHSTVPDTVSPKCVHVFLAPKIFKAQKDDLTRMHPRFQLLQTRNFAWPEP